MAHFQGERSPTDAYGNPVPRKDEYGNQVQECIPGATGYGTHDTSHMTTGTGTGYGTQGGLTGTDQPGVHRTTLNRSGSSGSSSSEDDGYGGRRKKGLKEKIKEKMPGGHKDEQQYGTTTGAYGEQYQEKGMMDKIKDKLPGGHKTDDPYSTTHTTSTTTGPYSTTGTYGEQRQEKGMMDKIKEKFPGGHSTTR